MTKYEMPHAEPDAGVEWLVEAHGCEPEALRELGRLESLLSTLIRDLPLHPVAEPVWHRFPEPGGGITGMCLLAESHFACHTYPEHASLTLNLFCCRPRPDFDFESYLKRRFGAAFVKVRKLDRPYGAAG